MSNESEVRGLWSVIIFIWTTLGGAEGAGGWSHPHVTVHCLAAAVMSTRLLLSVADGTSKNKCYLSLSGRVDSERNSNVRSRAWPGSSVVFYWNIRGILKERTGQEKVAFCMLELL